MRGPVGNGGAMLRRRAAGGTRGALRGRPSGQGRPSLLTARMRSPMGASALYASYMSEASSKERAAIGWNVRGCRSSMTAAYPPTTFPTADVGDVGWRWWRCGDTSSSSLAAATAAGGAGVPGVAERVRRWAVAAPSGQETPRRVRCTPTRRGHGATPRARAAAAPRRRLPRRLWCLHAAPLRVACATAPSPASL
jgi:hypothetical protein